MAFTASQDQAIQITERVGSAVSLLCSCTVIATFFSTEHFRSPVHRLIFFATWGNVCSNIGMLIALSGISRGETSALCQFQGFLIQWSVSEWLYLLFFAYWGIPTQVSTCWCILVALYGAQCLHDLLSKIWHRNAAKAWVEVYYIQLRYILPSGTHLSFHRDKIKREDIWISFCEANSMSWTFHMTDRSLDLVLGHRSVACSLSSSLLRASLDCKHTNDMDILMDWPGNHSKPEAAPKISTWCTYTRTTSKWHFYIIHSSTDVHPKLWMWFWPSKYWSTR